MNERQQWQVLYEIHQTNAAQTNRDTVRYEVLFDLKENISETENGRWYIFIDFEMKNIILKV